MKSSARTPWIVMPVLLFSLAGCGKQGDLYLPDERQEAVPATDPSAKKPVLEGSRVRTLPPAPQSQKKDRERADPSAPAPSQSQPPPVSPPDPDRPATPPPPPRQ